MCKSKSGRIRHIRAKHETISDSNTATLDSDLDGNSSQIPVQSPQGSLHPSSPRSQRSSGSQFENFDMDFETPPALGMFLVEYLI